MRRGALLCSALLLLLLLLFSRSASARPAKIVCICTVQVPLSAVPYLSCLCARTAATAAWASTVVCGIAALVSLLPSYLRALPCTLEPHTQLTSPQGPTQPWPVVAAQLQTDAIAKPASQYQRPVVVHPVKQTHDPGFIPAAVVKLPWFQIRSSIHLPLLSVCPSVCLCLPSPPALLSPLPFCLQKGALPACLQQEQEKGTGQGGGRRRSRGQGGMEGGWGTYLAHVLEDPLHRSDPPPPSSYLVIFCCHSCTAPYSTVPCRGCSIQYTNPRHVFL